MHVKEIKDLYSRIIDDNPENEIDAIINELRAIPIIKEQLTHKENIPVEERIRLIKLLTRIIDSKIVRFDDNLANPRFTDYRRDYYRNIKRYKTSSQEELWQAVDNAGIISVADFHFAHEPRFFLLMTLRHLLQQNERVTLALEQILLSEQRLLDDYLSRRNNHNIFAMSAQAYSKDPLTFQLDRVIYEFLKDHRDRVRTIGTDTKSNLSDRDRHAAVLIAREKERNPEVPVVVFAGDLHFAPSHLPAEIRARTDATQVIIYQNIPMIYYSLLRQEIDPSTSVVRLNKNSFCVTSLSPLELAIAHLDYKNLAPEEVDIVDVSYHEKSIALLKITYLLNRIPLKEIVPFVKELYKGTRILKEVESEAA